MQKINLYIAELMIIFAFIYNNLKKEGIVMKRMMKSKILATALCATVMAGIYASPVMAKKLYYGEVGDIVFVNGNVPLREEIKDLELDGKLTVGEIEVDKLNGVKLGDLVDKSALEQEKNDRIAGDTALEEKINGESLIRQKADIALEEKINGESLIRQKADQELADKIGQEEADRKAADDSIRGEISQEVADRAKADAELDKKIGDEADARIDADNKLSDRIDAETDARKDADNKLNTKIDAETDARKDADNKLNTKIDAETDARKAEDVRLDGRINDEATTRANEDKRIEAKFDGEVSRLDSRIDKLDANVEKVGAMAAAIANLHTMGYDPEAPTEIAVGVGQYRDKTGLALGAFHYPNRDFMLSFNVSTAGDEFMGGIGATWKFGRKSPEELRQAEAEKAAKAKLAKAEAAKKAAKDARVAAQQKRHAEMLAARTGK